MSNPHSILFTEEEENRLNELVSKGFSNARTIKRAQILLKWSEGYSARTIAVLVNVHYNTAYSIKKKYELGGLDEALFDAPRPGAPRKIFSEHEAAITTIACSDPPEGNNEWTLQMLADKVVQLTDLDSVGKETIRRVLKKVN